MRYSELLSMLPDQMKAKDCVGWLFGRPVPLRVMFDLANDLSYFSRSFLTMQMEPPPGECGYCGRLAAKDEVATKPSCPTCGGDWDERIVRAWR